MSESRQQRRARERAERKEAGRAAKPAGAGPARPTSVPRPVRGYTIEVHRTEFDEHDDDDGVWWSAEAGLTDDSTGYDYEGREDLAALLTEVIEDARASWGSRYVLALEWTLTGDRGDPPVSLTAAAAEAGFVLPDRLDDR